MLSKEETRRINKEVRRWFIYEHIPTCRFCHICLIGISFEILIGLLVLLYFLSH